MLSEVKRNQTQSYVEGSDEVAPATSFFTTDRDGAVKLRMGTKEYPGSYADK